MTPAQDAIDRAIEYCEWVTEGADDSEHRKVPVAYIRTALALLRTAKPTAEKVAEEVVVEKVARAICRAGICGPRAHLNEQEDLHWRKYEIEARAAIAALNHAPVHSINNGETP